MRERIDKVMPMVREHMVEAQRAHQRVYDRPAQARKFRPGDRVLVLVPTTTSKFLVTWQGLYSVIEKVGPVTYHLRQPGRRKEEKVYHINLLKRWFAPREQLAAYAQEAGPIVDLGEQLSAAQKTELETLAREFKDVFSEYPGRTNIIQHEIRMGPGTIVRQRPYRVPEARRQAI
ncbi:MAG: hypothetical protein ACRC64_08155, partial [Plesiomonas shigelloides]